MSKHNITAICYDKRGRILSIGKNSYVKTHPLQARLAKKVGEEQKIYLHAEIAAIIRCKNPEQIKRMTVVRVNKKGEALCAKPCRICQEAISLFDIEVEHS